MNVECIERCGYTLERVNGKIVSLSFQGRHIECGQRVISNGRLVREGCGGTVTEIEEPYVGLRTSDCISVHWDGEPVPNFMKLKDLR